MNFSNLSSALHYKLCAEEVIPYFETFLEIKNQMYHYWKRVGRPRQSNTQPRALHNIGIQTVLKRSPSGVSELKDAAVRNWAISNKTFLKVIS